MSFAQRPQDFSANHHCDDTLRGVTYRSLLIVAGGRMPDLRADGGDGRLIYLRFGLSGPGVALQAGRRYAFMIGFAEPATARGFTLANRNRAGVDAPPSLADRHDTYHAGWGIRREGDGTMPPDMSPGDEPPSDRETCARLLAQAVFPSGTARFAVEPGADGYPDVDTYRDLEFYLLRR